MSRGLAKPSLFKVEIPRAQSNGQFSANDYLEYYCKATTIPGISHDIHVINGHARQGIVSSQPYGVKYGKPLSLTIIERSDYHSYDQFREWFDLTFNNGGMLNGAQRMSYRNDYTCPIILKKYEMPTYSGDKRPVDFLGQGTPDGFRTALEINFEKVYISSIGDISLNTESRNAMIEYNVEFMYDKYKITMGKDSGSVIQ